MARPNSVAERGPLHGGASLVFGVRCSVFSVQCSRVMRWWCVGGSLIERLALKAWFDASSSTNSVSGHQVPHCHARRGATQAVPRPGTLRALPNGLHDEVQRSGWIVLAYCWLPNHIHALIQTPEPNLAHGMQHWLSGYANWYAQRNGRTGHLYQARYKAFLVEDARYDWPLIRTIHLNPCRGGKSLADEMSV